MNFFGQYLRQRRRSILVFIAFCLIFLVVFLLYHLPAGAVLYPALVCGLLGLSLIAWDMRKAHQKHHVLQKIQRISSSLWECLPPIQTQDDADYQQIIQLLREEQKQLENTMNLRYLEMIDYYTIWAHQIKTPIASMRLTLQNEDTAFSRNIAEDLFRIEQYVEMVLCYLRLDSDTTDYVICPQDLDRIIRQVVKKLSSQFIRRKIQLIYQPVNAQVITDEKWLAFVIEQVLSNALKYTPPGGCITIDMEHSKTLCIRDTGIGIAPEDLPRVFDKGYTGYNGRNDKKASGIGLYLCRRICSNLGHRIAINSALDSGTVVRIYLDQKKLQVE